MSTLNQFLVEKRVALRAIQAAGAAKVDLTTPFLATGHVAGGTRIREIRIRDFQIVTDVVETFAGYDLGPSAPELMLGALASCLMHTGLIIAADKEYSLKSMSVEVWGQMNPMAQTPGFEHIPIAIHNIGYNCRGLARERRWVHRSLTLFRQDQQATKCRRFFYSF